MATISKRWLAILGIGACAICCSVPLAGLFGLSIGVGAGMSVWAWLQAEWLCALLIFFGMGLVILLFRRIAQRNSKSCNEICDIDQTCCSSD